MTLARLGDEAATARRKRKTDGQSTGGTGQKRTKPKTQSECGPNSPVGSVLPGDKPKPRVRRVPDEASRERPLLPTTAAPVDFTKKTPFVSAFEFRVNRKCFVARIGTDAHVHERTCTGLTDTLHDVFSGGYVFGEVKEQIRQKKTRLQVLGINQRVRDSSHTVAPKSKPYGGARLLWGQRGGSTVDRQLNCAINNQPLRGTRADGSFDTFAFTETEYETAARCIPGLSRVTMSRLHPQSRMVIEVMDRHGYEAVQAQVPVGDLDIGLATACDSIWRHRVLGLLILVELKKCETYYYTHETGMMEAPFEDQPNHTLNQHQLQLAFTKHLFEKTYNTRLDGAMVLRVHSKGVNHIPLVPWTTERMDAAVSRVSEYMHQRRKLASLDAHAQETSLHMVSQDNSVGPAETEGFSL
jgi:hypothetical protein